MVCVLGHGTRCVDKTGIGNDTHIINEMIKSECGEVGRETKTNEKQTEIES